MAGRVQQAPKKTMADRLTVELRAHILRGGVLPGQKLREESIAEEVGCGRGPVREALSRLAERGLLEKQAFSGYTMRAMRIADIRDYYDRGSAGSRHRSRDGPCRRAPPFGTPIPPGGRPGWARTRRGGIGNSRAECRPPGAGGDAGADRAVQPEPGERSGSDRADIHGACRL